MKTQPYPELPILVVDDEEHFLNSMKFTLRLSKITNVECCGDSRQVMKLLEQNNFSLILLDLIMPNISGEELLPQILEEYPHLPVIVITAINEAPTIVNCMKNGAFDYLTKPIDNNRLINIINHALDCRNKAKENVLLMEALLSETLKNPGYFKNNIITKNLKMLGIFKLIETIAEFNTPVLITGETGTGKELIARAIHDIKESKPKGKFIADNVAGWNEDLFTDTLYGHEKGAFTGANYKRQGLLEQAVDGTIFLDEIGDLIMPLQTKLLRLIQEKEYFTLGSDKPKKTNARFVLATNKDLNALKETGEFRKDLFFRLNTHHIKLPTLKERKEDIFPLANYFLEKASKKFNKKIPRLHEKLINLLSNYDFPGNIRELESMIDEAMSVHQSGVLSLDAFMKKIREQGREINFSDPKTGIEPNAVEEYYIIFGDSFPTFKKMKRIYTAEAMKRSNNKQTDAAKLADLTRSTFVRYLKGKN